MLSCGSTEIRRNKSTEAEGTYDWGGSNDGVCVSTYALGGSGGMLPQKKF